MCVCCIQSRYVIVYQRLAGSLPCTVDYGPFEIYNLVFSPRCFLLWFLPFYFRPLKRVVQGQSNAGRPSGEPHPEGKVRWRC